MAKIPRLQSSAQVRPTSTSPGARLQTTNAGKNQQAIGEAVSVLADQVQKIITDTEITKADTAARRQLKELEVEAETSNILDASEYQKRIEAIGNETSRGISLPAARSQYKANFSNQALISDFNIRRTLTNRRIDEAVATMGENLDLMRESYVSAPSEKERELLLKQMKMKIDNRVASRIIKAEEGRKLKNKTEKDWKQATIRVAIAEDSEAAKVGIINGDFGDLTADESAKWLEVADKKTEKNKAEAQVAKEKLWSDTAAMVQENILGVTVEDIARLMTDGKMDPELGKDLINFKRDKKSVGFFESDSKTALELIRDLDEGVSLDQSFLKFSRQLGRDMQSGLINAKDGSELSINIKKIYELAKKKNNPNKFIKFMNSIGNFFTRKPGGEQINSDDSYRSTIQLLSEIADETASEASIRDKAREVKNELLRRDNPTLMDSEDPTESSYRLQAVDILKTNGYPTDESNIKAAIEQLKQNDAK